MMQTKRFFLLVAAGLLVLAGKAWADDKAPASTTPTAKATVAAKPAKADSPTVAAMKAANALAADNKTDEAIAAYEKMGVLKTKSMESWRLNNEAHAYLMAATPVPDKAVSLLEKSTETDDSNFVAWNNLGSAYENTGDLEKAKDAYQKSIDAAKAANASSAKADGNLQALQARLDKQAAKKDKADKKAGTKPAATPAAAGDKK
jgi:tetratricopeptide (TPR) repeat protein